MNKRYLRISTSYEAQSKRLLFYHDGQLVLDLEAKLDEVRPDTCQYIDIGRFLGETLVMETEPEMALSIKQTDAVDNTGLYQEKYRPVAHFTAMRGWINDPNGLVFAGGQYHLFFQHNPVGRDWGNMHWGHAVSTDLLHWNQRNIALFPDEMGTMFSGSGIVDYNNRTGLKETDQDVILLFYTAAGGTSKLSEGRPFTQCMAYSTDGGLTFRKYPGNPLIQEAADSNRDPKVIYHKALDCYCLALYLTGNRYALFISKDLLHWQWHQEITLPEDGECPDFYPLYLDGGEEYWVLTGAGDRYLVGKFHADGYFTPMQPVKRLHYGTNSYAAQTFTGIADGRTIRIAWNTANIPNMPFNCAMCIPTEMSLKTIEGEYRLCSTPIREISTLYAHQQRIAGIQVKEGEFLTCPLYGKAQDIQLRLSSSDEALLRLDLLGVEATVNPRENSLKIKDSTMPLFKKGNDILLRIITDTNAVEIFADEGEAFLCVGHVADYNLNRLILKAEKSEWTVHDIQAAELQNIWNINTSGN